MQCARRCTNSVTLDPPKTMLLSRTATTDTPHYLPRLGSTTAHKRFTMRNIVALLTASHMLYSPNAAHLWHSLARCQQAAAIMHTNNFLGSSSNLDPLLMLNGTECCRGCCFSTKLPLNGTTWRRSTWTVIHSWGSYNALRPTLHQPYIFMCLLTDIICKFFSTETQCRGRL